MYVIRVRVGLATAPDSCVYISMLVVWHDHFHLISTRECFQLCIECNTVTRQPDVFAYVCLYQLKPIPSVSTAAGRMFSCVCKHACAVCVCACVCVCMTYLCIMYIYYVPLSLCNVLLVLLMHLHGSTFVFLRALLLHSLRTCLH